jgi:hypothetical protein
MHVVGLAERSAVMNPDPSDDELDMLFSSDSRDMVGQVIDFDGKPTQVWPDHRRVGGQTV